jgi:integrase
LIDALSFWCHGQRHVTAAYGVEGFTAEHLQAFKEHGVERVLIAYDRDDAGDRAAVKLAERLQAEGIECFRVLFPAGMDANSLATSTDDPAGTLAEVLRAATWLGSGPAPRVPVPVPVDVWPEPDSAPGAVSPAHLADPLGLHDRVMLELFYATGLRRSELTRLRVFDLDIERLTLAVRQGKGRKDRMIPTGERAAAWAARYLADTRPRLAVEPDDGILFLTVDGTPFSPDRLTGLVADYVKRSGVGKPGACHLFRHTMATLMLEGGADIRFIQQMLGHADISTTQIYTEVSLRQLRAIHTATHPAAQNTPRRQRPNAAAPMRPAAGFETEVLHIALDAETREETAQHDDSAVDDAGESREAIQ